MPYSLIVVDVQENVFHNLKDKSPKEKIVQAVKAAIAEGQGIVVCEYDLERLGGTCDWLADLLKDYKRWLQIEYFEKPVGDEPMAVLRQRGYDRKQIHLVGLGDLEPTKHRCGYITNFQNEVEVLI